MDHTVPYILQFDEFLDVGSDTLTGVNDGDYQPPFPFTGKIDKKVSERCEPQNRWAEISLRSAQRGR